jgi:predicted dinucleotide-binding enzyme
LPILKKQKRQRLIIFKNYSMYNKSMKVGILGSGVVGQVLAKAFLDEGHPVMLGSRNNTKDQMIKWKEENPTASIGTYQDTAAFGELLVLAT